MNIDDEILIGELRALGPIHAEIERDILVYLEACERLSESAKLQLQACEALFSVTEGKSPGSVVDLANRFRFEIRMNGLNMLEASRQLSKISSKTLSFSEKMAAIIADKGGATI